MISTECKGVDAARSNGPQVQEKSGDFAASRIVMSTDQAGATQIALRHSFVSMLFALVVAEVAIQASRLFEVIANPQSGMSIIGILRDVPVSNSWTVLAPLGHLILVFVLVSTSWVGWSRSIDRDRDIEQIFSVSFLQLLIELSLVVLYFVLARSVELTSSGPAAIPSPSVVPEAKWLFCIYVGYAVWDLFNDALPSKYPEHEWPWFKNSPVLRWLGILISGVVARCSVSALCAGAVCLVTKLAGPSSTALSAASGDAALLCVVIFFWLAKDWEPWIASVIAPERHRKGTRATGQLKLRHVGSIALIFIYIIFLILMRA
jgi:hypothetical protein